MISKLANKEKTYITAEKNSSQTFLKLFPNKIPIGLSTLIHIYKILIISRKFKFLTFQHLYQNH